MTVPSVSLALDESRTFSASGASQRSLSRLIDSKHVISVDGHTVETVAVSSIRDVVNRHALFDRNRVRVLVVFADKNDWEAVHACKVQGLVKVAGIARAFAEIGDDDVVGAFDLERVSNSGSDRQVCTKHARIAENPKFRDPAVKRRVPTLRQAGDLSKHLRHHDPRLDAFHEKTPEISVQRADVVLLAEPETGADYDGLLTDAGIHATTHFALTDKNAEPFVESPNQLQPEEHVQELFRRQFELGSFDWRHRGASNLNEG